MVHSLKNPVFLFSTLLILLNCASVIAASPDDLAGYEQSLFTRSYEDEPIAQRLNRLENSVFGEVQDNSTFTERQARLIKVLGAARQAIPSAASSSPPEASAPGTASGISSFASPGSPKTRELDQAQEASPPRVPDATDYPTVTALERQVFGRDFIREDIRHRLDRLEKKVFGQSSPQIELVDRVDKLLGQYPAISAKPVSTPVAGNSDNNNSAIRDLPANSGQFVGSSRDVYAQVDALEKKRLQGKTYPNNLLTERLDRLETQAYGKKHSGESIDTRVNRLKNDPAFSATSMPASPSLRPGFQDRLPYQSYAGQPVAGSLPQVISPPGYNANAQSAATPKNVQIGAGFSQNSRYQFSPEMMSMLPPTVRNQMGGARQSNSSTVIGAPSTVVIEQTTTTPGFQAYGGQPIQYYNYYGMPNMQTQSQTTTTVLQPDGSAAVYSYPGASMIPGHPNNLPNPAYVGDPAFLQSLGKLESQVFGQINTVDPVYLRLGKLESLVLGQMYVGYPEGQRLNNLEKAYQLKAVGRLLGQNGNTAGNMMQGVPFTTPNPMNMLPMPMNMAIPGR